MVWKRHKRVGSPRLLPTNTATGRTTETAMGRFTGYFPHVLGSGGVVKTCDGRRLYEKP